MKLRDAAALALVGWYLITPPIEICVGAFSGGSCAQMPFSKWQIRATSDSLAKCEKIKAVWIEKGQMYLGRAMHSHTCLAQTPSFVNDATRAGVIQR